MVQDNTPPTLGPCPADIQSCSSMVSFVAPSYTDNCVLVNLTASYVSGSTFPSGTTVVTYTATDVAGNTATCAFNITITSMGSTLDIGAYNGFGVSCFGNNNGTATLTMTSGVGPFTFAWSNNFTQTTSGLSTLSGLSAGSYTVTVTGVGTSGCTLVRNFTITQPQAITCSIAGQNISCANTTGSVTLTATGGTLPYSYTWSNGASTQNLTNLATSGIYTVTLTDANGCVCTNSVTIQNTLGTLGSGNLVGNQYEGSNGTSIPSFYNVNTIEISGGTQPYTYNWNTTGYVQYSIIAHSNGSVTITVVYSDNAVWGLTIANCQGEQLYFDNQPDSPTSSTVLDIESYVITPDNGTLNGTISLNVEGGTTCANGTYNYTWEGQQNIATVFTNSPNQTGLKTGWYIVTVTDCSGQTSIVGCSE